MDATTPVNVLEYEAIARRRLDAAAFDYVAGGAGDEVTLRENCAAFARLTLRPRMLVDVAAVDLATSVLGRPLAMPVLLAPTSIQALAHPDGERATARAAAAAGTIMVAATMSSYPLEDIAAAAPGPKWFQLYGCRDRAITRRLLERAEAAGYCAVCLTVDMPRVGRRERDLRNGFTLPPHAVPRNFEGLADVTAAGDGRAFAHFIATLVDPSATWALVDWLGSLTALPIVVKGIVTAEDARRAVDCGAAAIVVSNHGGRQLDGVPATIDVLDEVVGAVQGRAEVLLDGGVRRGTDVVKALALGARAVLVGRPYVWALAVAGEAGVRDVLALLHDETELAMALLGCCGVADLAPGHVRRAAGERC